MDIRIPKPDPDAAERAAVDAVLEPPARAGRDLLLPALHSVQERFGWLPPGALNYICRRLTLPPAEVFGVATFYHLFSVTSRPATVIHVCDDIASAINGAEHLCAELEKTFGPENGAATPGMTWKRSPCLGQCERPPAVLVSQAGEAPRLFSH